MKSFIPVAVGAVVAASVLAGCATGTSEKAPTGADLMGAWAQNGSGFERGSHVIWEDQTVVIEQAEGQGFTGFKEYHRDGEQPQREVVNGVVGVNGEIVMADDDGFFEGRLVDGKILGQYVEAGEDHGALNVELTRK